MIYTERAPRGNRSGKLPIERSRKLAAALRGQQPWLCHPPPAVANRGKLRAGTGCRAKSISYGAKTGQQEYVSLSHTRSLSLFLSTPSKFRSLLARKLRGLSLTEHGAQMLPSEDGSAFDTFDKDKDGIVSTLFPNSHNCSPTPTDAKARSETASVRFFFLSAITDPGD
eukprot:3567286-Rhodomonas_salina.1